MQTTRENTEKNLAALRLGTSSVSQRPKTRVPIVIGLLRQGEEAEEEAGTEPLEETVELPPLSIGNTRSSEEFSVTSGVAEQEEKLPPRRVVSTTDEPESLNWASELSVLKELHGKRNRGERDRVARLTNPVEHSRPRKKSILRFLRTRSESSWSEVTEDRMDSKASVISDGSQEVPARLSLDVSEDSATASRQTKGCCQWFAPAARTRQQSQENPLDPLTRCFKRWTEPAVCVRKLSERYSISQLRSYLTIAIGFYMFVALGSMILSVYSLVNITVIGQTVDAIGVQSWTSVVVLLLSTVLLVLNFVGYIAVRYRNRPLLLMYGTSLSLAVMVFGIVALGAIIYLFNLRNVNASIDSQISNNQKQISASDTKHLIRTFNLMITIGCVCAAVCDT